MLVKPWPHGVQVGVGPEVIGHIADRTQAAASQPASQPALNAHEPETVTAAAFGQDEQDMIRPLHRLLQAKQPIHDRPRSLRRIITVTVLLLTALREK